ncbi:phage terminase large subunit family protein [Chromobacterium violaceum]|nr:phage terminase large subunit family protein [Chromobacterium violaceum]
MNPNTLRRMRETVRKTIKAAVAKWAPPDRVPTREWANRFRYLSSVEAARPGKFVLSVTPYLEWENGPLDAIDDPAVREVVCQKSAQVAWTSGVLGNALGKWIDTDPSPILVLFPKDGAAKEYMAEKFQPMVEATPRLREKVNLTSRKAQQRQLFKRFPGGFLKLVGSNSPTSVKSTPSPRVCVEEPDDCNMNLRGQGDSIKLAKERVKTYRYSKVLLGGTPTIEGASAIASEMELSDKRVGMIPCHACGAEHVLSFDNLRWESDSNQSHAVYGHALPETAHYVCPHCEERWTDQQKNRNVRAGRWVATAPFRGIAGFYLNELYSPFPGSYMHVLAEKWLTALYEQERGDQGPIIAFVNSSMGIAYTFTGDMVKATALEERALEYEEDTVPVGGLILTAGIDTQPDRLEVLIRAWGRGEESWLVKYVKLYGSPAQATDPVWSDLDALLTRSFKDERGNPLRITAVSIDSSDGNTSDGVYAWVRRSQRKGIEFVMAIKGSTEQDAEIFTKPKMSSDTNRRNTKASKYGVKVHMVGVSRAKDLLIGTRGRVSLEGSGPGRFHTYQGLSPEYYEQLLESEVKAPVRRSNGHVIRAWIKKTGKRNEVLDCEVYNLHASRAAKVHLKTDAQWDAMEHQLSQVALFDVPESRAQPSAQPSGESAAPRKSLVRRMA